jgi:hypothetical protein
MYIGDYLIGRASIAPRTPDIARRQYMHSIFENSKYFPAPCLPDYQALISILNLNRVQSFVGEVWQAHHREHIERIREICPDYDSYDNTGYDYGYCYDHYNS